MSMSLRFVASMVLVALLLSPGLAQAQFLYVGDAAGSVSVRKFDASGVDQGAFINNTPVRGITWGPVDGNFYLAAVDRIKLYDGQTGAFIQNFTTPGAGGMNGVSLIEFGPDGHLYACSRSNNSVLRYDGTTGAFIDAFATTPTLDPNGLVFTQDGRLLITSLLEHTVHAFDATTGADLGALITTDLNHPYGIAIGPDGNVYVSSQHNDVRRFDINSGAFLNVFASGGLSNPVGMDFKDGDLYVVSNGNDRVYRFDGTTGASLGIFASTGLVAPVTLEFAPAEICDGIDNDGNGQIDDGLTFVDYYPDADGDGFGDAGGVPINACAPPAGHVDNNTDCDDTDDTINPGAAEACNGTDDDCNGQIDDGLVFTDYYPDADGDGFGDSGAAPVNACAPPANHVADNTDCDDTNDALNPGASEVCNGVDENCNGQIDEGLTFVDYYPDADGDGFGDGGVPPVNACSPPANHVADDTDCDDTDDTINPGASEVCNGVDENCNGQIDDGLTFTDYYPDADSDGYGDSGAAPQNACSPPPGTVDNNADCDDTDGSINPDASETCDGVDENCNGQIDEGLTFVDYYPDTDLDGFGDAGAPPVSACSPPAGHVTDNTDCDDTDDTINPAAAEVCNGVDDDCSGQIDDGLTFVNYYPDNDLDGFGDSGALPVSACSPPAGHVTDNTDCDDTNDAINPAAAEACNGVDDDCNGQIDDGLTFTDYYPDADSDGYGDSGAAPQNACSPPLGTVDNNADCDDTDGSINPDASETCDGVDENCNGQIDEGLTFVNYYPDNDLDGFGDSGAPPISACSPPAGHVTDNTDCDDTDDAINPAAPEACNGVDDDCNEQIDDGLTFTDYYPDADGDGFGDSSAPPQNACVPPGGTVDNNGDCDDTDDSINPDAPETCNGADDDCNGQIDEGLTTADYYPDADGDGFGDSSASPQNACAPPGGTVDNNDDCDDTDDSINPDAPETCNGVDDDCNGQIDDGLTTADYYPDADGDGFGDSSAPPQNACAPPGGTVDNNGDCDDTDDSINPDAPETCNGVDDDCNGQIDDGLTTADYYPDADGDGFGDSSAPPQNACAPPGGTVDNNGDCDDTDDSINPDATEACNGVDDDCNGQIDDGVATTTWYADGDMDGYGDPDNFTDSCAQPPGFVDNSGDCDDTDSAVNPDAAELCNGIDDDCNGQVDDGLTFTDYYPDGDLDGFGDAGAPLLSSCVPPPGHVDNNDDCDDTDDTINPDATEVCNGVDDDCNGQIDDGVATTTWYADGDMDGFGDPDNFTDSCVQPPGFVDNSGDCDDTDSSVNPDATELCNGVDDDCNGQVDDGLTFTDYYPDGDLDGFGDAGAPPLSSCVPPPGHVDNNGDCDDTDSGVNPDADEICANGIDEDCNGEADDGCIVPVQLAFFRLTTSDGTVQVQWQTVIEESVRGYQLWRTRDGSDNPAVVNVNLIESGLGSYEFVDTDVVPGETYAYQLESVDLAGDSQMFSKETVTVAQRLVKRLVLHAASPNPFNPATLIAFELPAAGHVRLTIFDISGRIVRTLVDRNHSAGQHAVRWNGEDDNGLTVGSGTYLYRLDQGTESRTKKMILIK